MYRFISSSQSNNSGTQGLEMYHVLVLQRSLAQTLLNMRCEFYSLVFPNFWPLLRPALLRFRWVGYTMQFPILFFT